MVITFASFAIAVFLLPAPPRPRCHSPRLAATPTDDDAWQPEKSLAKATLAARKDSEWYRKTLAKRPLLTHQEEIALGCRVQRLNALNDRRNELTEQLGRRATVAEVAKAEGEDEAFIRRELSSGREARKELVEANQRLVLSLAARYSAKSGAPIEDLAQDGTIGLLKAVHSYDPARGNRFATYAWYSVQAAILRGVLDQSNQLRLSSYMHSQVQKMREAWATLEMEKLSHGDGTTKTPSVDELAESLGVPVSRVRDLERIRLSAYSSASLDASVSRTARPSERGKGRAPGASQREDTFLDLLPDRSLRPEELAIEGEGRTYVRQSLTKALRVLTERERQVIALRYGVDHLLDEGDRASLQLKRRRVGKGMHQQQGSQQGGAEGGEERETVKHQATMEEEERMWGGLTSLRQVGKKLGISAERAQQIYNTAVRKLRTNSGLASQLSKAYHEYVADERSTNYDASRENNWDI